MDASQSIIMITGIVAIWLTQDPLPERARWACIVGLIGQPFWIGETYAQGQYGMLALSVVYTLAWCRGVWVYWIKA